MDDEKGAMTLEMKECLETYFSQATGMTGFQKENLGKRSSLYDYSQHAENTEIIKERRQKRKELWMLFRKKDGERERDRQTN